MYFIVKIDQDSTDFEGTLSLTPVNVKGWQLAIAQGNFRHWGQCLQGANIVQQRLEFDNDRAFAYLAQKIMLQFTSI